MLSVQSGLRGAHPEELVVLLHDAEEDDELIRRALTSGAHDVVTAWVDQHLVGAALVDWNPSPDHEILYLAVEPASRGRGYGRALVAHVMADLAAHDGRLVVGTGNSSLDNIAFYQRCGFRMDAVRRGHFDYVDPAVTEFGIRLRDMLVFSYELPGRTPAAGSGRLATSGGRE